MTDRLHHLEDRKPHYCLQVYAEVPVSVCVQDIYGNDEIIKGRADWALGYGADKSDTGLMLLVIEAKPYESASVGMPQLLVSMAAIHKARQKRMNKGVFGMVSDSQEFRFAFLDENKKLVTSRPFLWVTDQSTIIAYIDMMLVNAIESSPHTTPQKQNNRAILKYSELLRKQCDFGDESNGRGTENEEEKGYDMVDIVNVGGRVVLRGPKY